MQVCISQATAVVILSACGLVGELKHNVVPQPTLRGPHSYVQLALLWQGEQPLAKPKGEHAQHSPALWTRRLPHAACPIDVALQEHRVERSLCALCVVADRLAATLAHKPVPGWAHDAIQVMVMARVAVPSRLQHLGQHLPHVVGAIVQVQHAVQCHAVGAKVAAMLHQGANKRQCSVTMLGVMISVLCVCTQQLLPGATETLNGKLVLIHNQANVSTPSVTGVHLQVDMIGANFTDCKGTRGRVRMLLGRAGHMFGVLVPVPAHTTVRPCSLEKADSALERCER